MTFQELLHDAAQQFEAVSTTPRLDAELIIAHAMQWQREYIFLHPDDTPTARELAIIEPLIAQRRSGEPLAYVLGTKEFYGMPFLVNAHVLVPRPETELLVDTALAVLDKRKWEKPTIVDACTGSGCVAITLQSKHEEARIIGTDISEEALAVARANDRANPTIELEWLKSDLLRSLPRDLRGGVDLIISNPPYVPAAEVDSADGPLAGALKHEPRMALVPQKDGHDADPLYVINRLLKTAGGWLAPKGVLLMEMGHDQGDAVRSLAQKYFPEASVTIHKDLEGRDRVIEIQS